MGHFTRFELLVLSEVFSLKNWVLEDLDCFLCLDSFLLDAFFLQNVQMLWRSPGDIFQSSVKKYKIKFRFNFFWVAFA